jgi:hypothetical protein
VSPADEHEYFCKTKLQASKAYWRTLSYMRRLPEMQGSQQVDAASTRLPANSQPKNKNAIRTGHSARITAPP